MRLRSIFFGVLLLLAIGLIAFGLLGKFLLAPAQSSQSLYRVTVAESDSGNMVTEDGTSIGAVGIWTGHIQLTFANINGGMAASVTSIKLHVIAKPEHFKGKVQNCDYYGDCKGKPGANGLPYYIVGDGAVLYNGTEKILPVSTTFAVETGNQGDQPEWPVVSKGYTDFNIAVVSRVPATLTLTAEVNLRYEDGHTATIMAGGKPVTIIFLPTNYSLLYNG